MQDMDLSKTTLHGITPSEKPCRPSVGDVNGTYVGELWLHECAARAVGLHPKASRSTPDEH